MKLNRRTALRGAGVCLSLPFLEAMGPGAENDAAEAVRCKRIATLSVPFGVVMDKFHPTDTGDNYEMPSSLKPMESVREHFTCFSNLDHGLRGGHGANHAFMSGIKSSQRAAHRDGNITIDQRIAEIVGHNTRFSSLNFWESGMSYTRSGVTVPSIMKPSDAFHLMFVDESADAMKVKRDTLNASGSILDAVRADARRFNAQLGKRDQEKMDEFFSSLRGTEKKIQASKNWLTKKKPTLTDAQPGKLVSKIAQGEYDITMAGPLLEAWFELMFLALQTDSTRVVSTAIRQCTWDLPDVTMNYHSLSHHGRLPEKLKQLQIIDTYLMTHLAKFIGRLRDTKEADGQSMLDSTLVLFGSGLGNGQHTNRNLPVVLAGGKFKHGQHLDNTSEKPLCNLYLNMLQQFDRAATYFNVSNGTMTGMEAR